MKRLTLFSAFHKALPETFLVGFVWILLLVQTIIPYEALDMAVARLIYRLGGGAWMNPAWWRTLFYTGGKVVAALILVSLLFGLYGAWKNANKERFKALGLAFISSVVMLVLMSAMKDISGVACPWSFQEFSHAGVIRKAIAPFSWLFTGSERLGQCWPAGHASCGFAFFGLWYAAKRLQIKHANLVLLSVIAFGLICGVGRMANGAHFLSHTVASCLLGLGVAGFIFHVFWPLKGESKISAWSAALVSGFLLTLLSLPFFSDMMRAATPKALFATLSVALLLFLLWAGFIYPFVRFMPKIGWRVVLAILALIGAGADSFTTLYGTVMTPDMLRNALSTDYREASELISLRFFLRTFLFSALGLYTAIFLGEIDRPENTQASGKLRSLTKVIFSIVFAIAFLLSQFSFISSYMRNNKEARYLIEPASVIYSFAKTFVSDAAPKAMDRAVIDPNPTSVSATDKPLLVVLVIGETVRAANWGLNGYERNTTPNLAKKPLINFSDVASCGTSTDVSVPCMFSRVGRENYDRQRILSEESILSVIERGGVHVRWVDNQSGCKGACTKSMIEEIEKNPHEKSDGAYFDTTMLGNVEKALKNNKGKELLVLHTLGNHGPAYWRRVPKDFKPFGAGCRKDDFGECDEKDIRISYDNAIAYTDSFLSKAIDALSADTEHDTVLLYVSDHGESLGEKGLWLHGAPYWMRLTEQMKVPMILWFNESAKKRFSIRKEKGNEAAPASHDFLFSTLLTLTEVKSSVYRHDRDLIARLRQ